MSVQETPAIKATIKKQKRLFETYELFNHAYLHEKKLYYYVQYFRFGRPLRFMLLYENGDMVERKLAEHIGFQVIILNQSALHANRDIRKQKDRKMRMITLRVKEIPAVKAGIKRQKRLFETYQLYSYSYLYKEELYYFVQYFRFGSPSRFIILDKSGDMVERELAEYISFQFLIFNELNKNLRKLKDRKVWMFEENSRTINQLRLDLGEYPEQIKQDVRIYNDMTETIVKGQAHLERLWTRVEDILNDVKEKGYITNDEVQVTIQIEKEYTGVVYRQGRKIKEAVEPIRRLVQFFVENRGKVPLENRKKVNRLISLLKANVKRRTLYNLNYSMQSYEKDADGNDIDIPPGEEGIQKVCEESSKNNITEVKRGIEKGLINY